jgi:hypothetical protein
LPRHSLLSSSVAAFVLPARSVGVASDQAFKLLIISTARS